ncbi:MAG: choice-of-anchor Q domain-containing protein, partial [Acidimicrobiales bacterium]
MAVPCTLASALGLVGASDNILLTTPGATAHYVGNWTVSTPATTPATPLTIEPEPGVTNPILDGNKGSSTGCTTTVCNGSILKLSAGVSLSVENLTIENADNTTTGHGGGIDSGDGVTGGTLVVSGVTFSSNTASNDGGAIDNGDNGESAVTVSASTFSANSAFDGGAVDTGDSGDNGESAVTVSASTFSANSATNGDAIEGGFAGAVEVAADIFAGSCDEGGATWDDGGYNVGSDASCFNSGVADTSDSSLTTQLGPLTNNGGPTATIEPTGANPALGDIPNPTAVTLASSVVIFCPTTDQRGVASPPSSPCDAGAVQVPPPLATPAFVADTPVAHTPVGAAFSYTFAARGNPAPTFALGSGTLPTNLTLTSAGVLSGTPTVSGTFTFTVVATNSQGSVTSPSITIT